MKNPTLKEETLDYVETLEQAQSNFEAEESALSEMILALGPGPVSCKEWQE